MYLDDAVEAITSFQKPVAWMYLDTNAAVCIGNHIRLFDVSDACDLPFHLWNAAPASVDEITAEYERVRQMPLNDKPIAFRRLESLQLTQDALAKLLRSSLVDYAVQLSSMFDDFDEFPDAVKVALLDMCYDRNLSECFPRQLRDAIVKHNWARAAMFTSRIDVSDQHNVWTQQQFYSIPIAV